MLAGVVRGVGRLAGLAAVIAVASLTVASGARAAQPAPFGHACTPRTACASARRPTSPRACRASTARRSTSTSRCRPAATARSRRSCSSTASAGRRPRSRGRAATRPTTTSTSPSAATRSSRRPRAGSATPAARGVPHAGVRARLDPPGRHALRGPRHPAPRRAARRRGDHQPEGDRRRPASPTAAASRPCSPSCATASGCPTAVLRRGRARPGTPISLTAAWPRWLWTNGESIFTRNGRGAVVAHAVRRRRAGLRRRDLRGAGVAAYVAPLGADDKTADILRWKQLLDGGVVRLRDRARCSRTRSTSTASRA